MHKLQAELLLSQELLALPGICLSAKPTAGTPPTFRVCCSPHILGLCRCAVGGSTVLLSATAFHLWRLFFHVCCDIVEWAVFVTVALHARMVRHSEFRKALQAVEEGEERVSKHLDVS